MNRENPQETDPVTPAPQVGDPCAACGTKLGKWYAQAGRCDWCGWDPKTGRLAEFQVTSDPMEDLYFLEPTPGKAPPELGQETAPVTVGQPKAPSKYTGDKD